MPKRSWPKLTRDFQEMRELLAPVCDWQRAVENRGRGLGTVLRVILPTPSWSAVDKAPEDLAGDADEPLIFADTDAELDRLQIGIPAGVLGKAEKHGWLRPACK